MERQYSKAEAALTKDFGHYEIKGRRATMEDVITNVYADIFPDHTPCLYLAVFDGHSGKSTADYASFRLVEELHASLSVITDEKAAIENAFMNTDDKWRVIHRGGNFRDSGCTANVCLITPTRYICANLGDARCVLARAGKAVNLSFDHKPYLDNEKARIEAAGSYVSGNRVEGMLAVSRAFGDFDFKKSTKAAKDHAVTAFPEIISLDRDLRDRFIVVACDGLWDVLSSQDVVDYVSARINAGDSAHKAAVSLVDEAFTKGSTDNISCIVVYL